MGLELVHVSRGAHRARETPGLALLSCFPLTGSHWSLLPQGPTALGSFHVAPGEETARREHPRCRHPNLSHHHLNP